MLFIFNWLFLAKVPEKLVTLKKSLTAFSMKVKTTPGDCDKVNQIVPIMQEHLGPVMNLARIKLLAFVLHALCIVLTVSLHKIASAMPTGVERDSNLRRLQRFLAGYALNLDLIAKVIPALLPVKTGLVLSLDRTNWKFGEVNINILMLGVTYKGVAFLLLFTMLDKRGNSNWKERAQLIDRFIRCSVSSASILWSQTASLSESSGSSISTTDIYGTTCESSRTSGCAIPNPPRLSKHGICFTASSSDRNVSTTNCFSSKANMYTSPEHC
ncbi:hypothetical protein IMSAGC021_01270 [Muribaculaceae bacterium]|nr:hypothetical protein IMSAGC021_01270 [Muribaculaceae bacterium]